MLLELLVENLAVIERVRVHFHSGLNLLTGETGSGKSIVVDALGLLFGGRSSAEMLRSGTERARISAIFEAPGDDGFRSLAESSGIETEDGELIVEREIQASGKSRAFAGGRPVTVGLLREVAPFLGDIHGQHDQQLLFSPDAQRDMLDEFAGLDLTEIRELYRAWRQRCADLADLEKNEQERLRLADLWAFQRREIESAAPKLGEDLELENERRILKNIGRLQESAAGAYEALYDAPASVYSQLKTATRKIEELAKIDENLAGVMDTLKPATIAVDEVSHTLRDYLGRLEADPRRLDDVESRLATLEKLKRKYGPDLEHVVAFLEKVKADLLASEDAGETRARLQRERDDLAEKFRVAAAQLSAKRRETAAELKRRVEKELAFLAMERTVFEARIHPAEWSHSGSDAVQFLISPNIGEEPRALERIASGGELSRIALALKTCAASTPRNAVARTLVFDEVDAGVGGGAAEAVGRRLKRLAATNQVLCVTHLPQIAGFADHHYLVSKRESDGRTLAAIEELDAGGRRREIGRMLSGERITPEALRHAEQLMKAAADHKRV
jgi:DNA repair protein RecN (Recombination protein N)